MLLIGFANTTDNPAYFRRLNSFSVQHTTAGHGKFLPTWSRPRGRHAPKEQLLRAPTESPGLALVRKACFASGPELGAPAPGRLSCHTPAGA